MKRARSRPWQRGKPVTQMTFLDKWKKTHPEKFIPAAKIFERLRPGDTVFIASACAEPRHLVDALIRHVEDRSDAFAGARALRIRTLGVTPYAEDRFKPAFHRDAFFIGDSMQSAVNAGRADYTPAFLSQVPGLFARGMERVDAALIQTSPPDVHGYFSLGIGVDIVKAAAAKARIVVAQVNRHMPRVPGDTFIHIGSIDFLVPHDEPLLEYVSAVDTEITRQIGKYVARLIVDGDTLQVGYGSIPNAILSNLSGKKHLGVHTELLSDGIVELMKAGVIDNSRKTVNRGKAVAAFCMGKTATYEYLEDNPLIELQAIDYTNDPLLIARQDNMVAINSALEIDLTGQATAESIGKTFYSGIGGQADFMRGAALARNGKTILTIQSTAAGGEVSRIVPFLKEGSGATVLRGDIQYVVTEWGIAYLQGKSVRERAMDLIAIAHPTFRPWLIEEAKKAGFIYRDQAFIPGERGAYPEEMETYRKTKTGLELFLRPVKFSDEPLLKDFLHRFSDRSIYTRFFTKRRETPYEQIQELVVIDYLRETAIMAVLQDEKMPGKEDLVGVGRYHVHPKQQTARVAFAVRDDYQNRGIAQELLSYLTYLARRQGLLGFTAAVLAENDAMLHVFEKCGFERSKQMIQGVVVLSVTFQEETREIP